MTDDSSRCAAPEQIAAFVAGNLSGVELATVAEHLRACDDCRLIAAEAARIDREPDEVEATPIRRRRVSPWWLVAAAAALAGIASLALWPANGRDENEMIHRLVAETPRDGRYLEPRLTGGFAWAPMQPVRRDSSEPLEPRQMQLIGLAGEVLGETAGDPSPEAQHATAVAHLLAGRPNEAAAVLERLSPDARDAQIWSDLAAALYAAGVQRNQPKQFAQALAAADTALRLEPKLPEALFNRALIVERLGLRDRAQSAWEQYLAVDPDGPWSVEARNHLQLLGRTSDFREELRRGYALFARDEHAARVLTQRYPQEARLWGETQILGRWAEAVQRKDEVEAKSHLRLARVFGDEIARSRGDRMLLDAVTAIDRASPEQQQLLADGHLSFRKAQELFMRARPLEAAPLFERAADAFARSGSPAALLARYFAANTVYDRGGIAETRARMEKLLATSPPQYAAHRAQVQWQMGLVYAAGGQWGEAMAAFDDSVRTFERLNETRYAAIVRGILAEAYDRIGDPRAAWAHRLIALHELGRTEDRRLQATVQAAARAAALERDWPVSLSFLDLVLDMPRRDRTDLLHLETLLFRARVEGRLAQRDAAMADVARATTVIERLQDSTVRERADADRSAVAGLLSTEPDESIANLTHAIEFHRVKGRRMFLPEMYLERGRAHERKGDDDAAAADYEAGIGELETQRLSLNAGDERWGMFAPTAELFEEAVALALARGDREAAFAYSERARARDLLDSMGAGSAVVSATPSAALLPPSNAVLIEYASLPTELVTFIVDRAGLRVVKTPIARATLTRGAERLTESAIARDAARFRENAAALYGLLLLPIEKELRDGRTLVFVPDATLSTVPFAGLLDGSGRYVIERSSVVVAPSAAVFTRLASRRRPANGQARLLLIAGAAGEEGDVRQLTSAKREADAVAAAYGRSDVAPTNTDRAAFESRAAEADVIHFVGHAEIPSADGDGALVVSRGAAGAVRIDVRSIASLRLPRTRAVVLAACGTARGQRNAGEATISVARAFLAAGAPSVVATLWPIDDEPAAEFFPRLHRHLADGLPPAEAVRATQIEWIQRRDAPPGMWAAVQMIGS
jgi:CHAT domain-containing protein